ncbi:MAG: bifunctional UDP-N-acetylglucosamine diphosphorylase/glucosamine-1-phosphate N-acetyltransferase GlmU [Proteobacteria bacterium]|nr:bifunctional UDP-N-acetylglucosamine diphosphorylase/glucosamine-1-phosphate N-acetyltransferase GlmU [Pseudomonadota bacterium]
MTSTAVILAAGMGTRMRSALPKTLHRIAGRTMLRHLLGSCEEVFDRCAVVIGPDMEAVAREAAPHPSVVQADRLGTAHAALQAAAHFGDGDVAVLYADNPLIAPATLRALLADRRAAGAGLALLAMRPPDPGRYGRVILRGGAVDRIVEWKDASEQERAEGLCNAGVLCAAAADMARWLRAVRPDNAAGEYYLTDVVAIARRDGAHVIAVEAPYDELRGINTRAELAEAEAIVQRRLRDAAMEGGATLTDPSSVFLSADTVLGQDVTIGPNVVIGPGVRIADGVAIHAFSHLEGCSIGAGSSVGPFARLRPGAVLERNAHVGNFVELKAATLGEGAKANHLSYLGDATVGAGSNIGAGTITCNYDGFAKHRTHIGAHAFIGSNTALVAPVSIGDGALIAAGSVITDDVAPDALAVARGRQHDKPGGAAAFRAAQTGKRKQA